MRTTRCQKAKGNELPLFVGPLSSRDEAQHKYDTANVFEHSCRAEGLTAERNVSFSAEISGGCRFGARRQPASKLLYPIAQSQQSVSKRSRDACGKVSRPSAREVQRKRIPLPYTQLRRIHASMSVGA